MTPLQLVLGIAARLSLPSDSATKKPIFDAERVWGWVLQLPDARVHRPLMKFAAWLWSSGTHDMELILALLEDRIRKNPANPYAYYAVGGPGRECRSAQINGARGERENEAFKAADHEFLGQ